MKLLIYLVLSTLCEALAAGLPQYQPPSSPVYRLKIPPPYPPGRGVPPLEPHEPMYTYAEVNTPYYQYHYYSPVYKNYPRHPAPFDTSSEHPGRNEVNSYVSGRPTTPLNLFYPAPTSTLLISPGFNTRNQEYPTQPESSKPLFSPVPDGSREVLITSKPILVNTAYDTIFKSYQRPTKNSFNLSEPVSTPTELALGSPNIIRDELGKVIIPGETLNKNYSFKPDIIIPANINSKPIGNPVLVVPESLATPSSTIIKDAVRRGIPSDPMFRNLALTPPANKYSGKSLPNSTKHTTNASVLLTNQTDISSELSLTVSNKIPIDVEQAAFEQTVDSLQNQPSNSSTSTASDIVNQEISSEQFSSSLLPLEPHSVQTPVQKPDKSTTHLQKIAKKVNPEAVSKKKTVFKYPNTLFYSPGHDIPI